MTTLKEFRKKLAYVNSRLESLSDEEKSALCIYTKDGYFVRFALANNGFIRRWSRVSEPEATRVSQEEAVRLLKMMPRQWRYGTIEHVLKIQKMAYEAVIEALEEAFV